MFPHDLQIRPERIGCDLDSAVNTLGDILDENIRVFQIPFAGVIADDEFLAGCYGKERVKIPTLKIIPLPVRQLL